MTAARIDPLAVAPSLMQEWFGTSCVIATSLDPSLVGLVKIRVSSTWHDAPCYSDRERAAPGWTEALTRFSDAHTHHAACEAPKAHLSAEDQGKPTPAILVANGWNGIAVGVGRFVGPAAIQARKAVAA